jgi:hypothetical protein
VNSRTGGPDDPAANYGTIRCPGPPRNFGTWPPNVEERDSLHVLFPVNP